MAKPCSKLAVVIPAYKPSPGLVSLVQTLSGKDFAAIIVVDDGSGPGYGSTFDQVAALPRVELLRHAVNLGKGAALRTAFNHVLCRHPELIGVVTADADGQHLPEDIQRVALTLVTRPDSLVLGSRQFSGDVPLRSRIGNVATRGIVHALLGRRLTDTQTGLRGIPSQFLPKLMRIESTGYEFELEMLIAAHQMEIRMVEEPIQTVYEAGNKSSHFNPIVDSMKIYFVLLRFGSVSFMTALLDNLIFYLAWRRTGHVLLAQVLGRAVGVTFNYWMVRTSVFYSKQRHQSTLPKFLLLVAASGSVSYAGIQFLTSRLAFPTMTAKLLVETLLFFVNFAVQRVFIFRPAVATPAVPEAGRRTALSGFVVVVAAVLAVLVGVEIYGFATGHLFHQEIWYPVGLRRFEKALGGYLLLAVPLLLMVPWAFAGVMLALLFVLTIVSVGLFPVLATAYFLISANALGSLVLRHRKVESGERQLCATVLGSAVYILLMTIVGRLPVNYPAVWGVLLAVPLAGDFRGARERLRAWTVSVRGAQLRTPLERVAFGVLVFIVIAQWFVALKPEIGTDGLAMHLAIPLDLVAHHRMTFEPSRFLWAVMPMGADWAYSIVCLLGGEYAARLLNFAMLLVVAGLLYQAVRRWLPPGPALLVAACFAATPVVQLVTGSLFVENLLASLVLAILTAIWQFGETGQRRYLFAAAVLGGAALNTKLGALAFLVCALPFLVAEIARQWRSLGRRPALVCAGALLLLVALASPTYVIAYAKTRNPIFPFQNRSWHSPLLDSSVDINDARYRIPIDLGSLYTLTFRSEQAYEGQNGSFGFQYLIAVPLALLGLFVVSRGHPARSAAVVAFGAGVLIMRSQPNIRYLYAAMPLILVPFGALLSWARVNQRLVYRAMIAVLFVCTALNAYFLPSSSYYHKEFCLKFPFSRAERDRYLADGAPIRKVIAWYNQHHAGQTVLFTANNEFAGTLGEVYENHWHQYPNVMRLRQAFTVEQMYQLMRSWHVNYFVAQKPGQGDPVRPQALQKLLDLCTVPEFQLREFYLTRLEPDCEARIHSPRQPDEPPLAVTAGAYDDFDPVLVYRGDWSHDESFAEPDRHTVSYTDVPGAEVSIAFQGSELFYLYTKAPNRGIASVKVDGADQGTVDLYSPKVEWHSRTRFCCFGPGKHIAVIRTTGQANPSSSGKFIDVDTLFVKE